MKMRIGRWLMGLAMLFVLAGVYTPTQAKAATGVVVVVHTNHRHHRHYHRHYRH